MTAKESAICGASTSGRVLAWCTLVPNEGGGILMGRATRLFHLAGRSQADLRGLAADIHQFIQAEELGRVSFCRTATGYGEEGLADEVRIEGALQFIPGLEAIVHHGDIVSDWARRTQPPLPVNCRSWPPMLAQVRAIEVAQFAEHLR